MIAPWLKFNGMTDEEEEVEEEEEDDDDDHDHDHDSMSTRSMFKNMCHQFCELFLYFTFVFVYMQVYCFCLHAHIPSKHRLKCFILQAMIQIQSSIWTTPTPKA